MALFYILVDFILEGPFWVEISSNGFVESLIQQHDKLVQVGVLKTSKNQSLLMSDSTNVQDKGKHKGKEPKASDSNPKKNQNSFEGALGSKKKKKF